MNVETLSNGFEDPFKEETLEEKTSRPLDEVEDEKSVQPTELVPAKVSKPKSKAKKSKPKSDEEDEILKLGNLDDLEETQGVGSQDNFIHIRIQQRNGRKTLTTIQGLPKQFDFKKVLKHFKKELACNGSLVDDEIFGNVIQLQGDQRQKVLNFFTNKEEGLALDEKKVKLHGF